MTTKRKLLELAAKAAGYAWPSIAGWNPLTDDGDALRLAVKLEIQIEPHPLECSAAWDIDAVTQRSVIEYRSANSGDPMRATRRAIVRAAAEIGKAMK